MDDLLHEVARLPERKHRLLSPRCSKTVGARPSSRRRPWSALAGWRTPPSMAIYRTYVGRGIVGGRVVSFEAEGERAARLAVRESSAGEKPESIASRGEREPLRVRLASATAVGYRGGSPAARQRRPLQAAEFLGPLQVADHRRHLPVRRRGPADRRAAGGKGRTAGGRTRACGRASANCGR